MPNRVKGSLHLFKNTCSRWFLPDINSLNFIHQCRDLGFSLEHCQHLLSLNNNQQRQAENVRQLAIEHLAEVNQKITKLEKLKRDLEQMIGHCQGGKQSKCAILDGINKA